MTRTCALCIVFIFVGCGLETKDIEEARIMRSAFCRSVGDRTRALVVFSLGGAAVVVLEKYS